MSTSRRESLKEIGLRLSDMREICEISPEDMAKRLNVSGADYVNEEYGLATFASEHCTKCAYRNELTGEYETWLTSQTINVDTTGFMR